MQDDTSITSSQELPLSQENFSEFFTDKVDQINMLSTEDICAVLENLDGIDTTERDSPRTDGYQYKSPMLSAMPASYSRGLGSTHATPVQASSSTVETPTLPPTAISCLPAINNWQGECEFNIFFEQQKEKKGMEKKVAWAYSQERDKLYVSKGLPCPINFVANVKALHSSSPLELRVQAIFSHPEYSNEIVRRCINHQVEDNQAGHPYSEFLIRCECDQAEYVIDSSTNQFSVVVPFQSPQIGQSYSSYIFKFMCFSSCTGGLNRRPIMVVFTLVKRGKIIGRRSLAVKICACPSRDCRNDDKITAEKKKEKKETSKKRKMESDSFPGMSELPKFLNKVSETGKKSNHLPDKDGFYTIRVQEKELYDFLRSVKHLYELDKTIGQLNPESTSLLKGMCKKMKKECDTDGSD